MRSHFRKFGRNVDIGFYPIPVTYESHGFYSTSNSQIFSILVLFLFIFYIINYEILPWANEEHYTVTTLTVKHTGSDISGMHENMISFINLDIGTTTKMVDFVSAPFLAIENGVRCQVKKENYTFLLEDCKSNCSIESRRTFLNNSNMFDTEYDYEKWVLGYHNYSNIIENDMGRCHIDSNFQRTVIIFGIYFEKAIGDILQLTADVDFTVGTQIMRMMLKRCLPHHTNYANVKDGFVEERKTEFVVADGFRAYSLSIKLQPIEVKYYSSLFPDTVSHTKSVFGKSEPAEHKSQALDQNIFPSNFETSTLLVFFAISTMELVIEVRPEPISVVCGRIGGLTTLLTILAMLLRYYNKSAFREKIKSDHGRLEYERVSQTCDRVESLWEHLSDRSSTSHIFHTSDETGGERVDMSIDVIKSEIHRYTHLERSHWESMKKEDLLKLREDAEEIIEFTNVALKTKNEITCAIDE